MKNVGNPVRIINVMRRALAGKSVTIAFIGGSITQGAAATDDSLCYAALVYRWWKRSFPMADIRYVNAGIGATTSQFGVARVKDDLLKFNPDFVIVEFSVNDNDEFPNDRREFFRETYEGLIRKIYSHKNSDGNAPAILIMHSVRYDDGSSEEEMHSEIGAHYGIPCISMKELIYDRVLRGEADFKIEDITQDMLHPNNFGHGIVAGHITDYLEGLRSDIVKNMSGSGQGPDASGDAGWLTVRRDVDELPAPFTDNRYEDVLRYNNLNCKPECSGFIADTTPVMRPVCINDGIKVLGSEARDVFKDGWTACAKGASITFRFYGKESGVMYRKSVKRPAPVAYAVIDGDTDHKTLLDANFDEDWGDKAYMATLMHHDTAGEHTLTVTLEEEGSAADFYLINVVCS